MTADYIDRFTGEWRQSRPEMAVEPVAGLLRVIRLAGLLERELADIAFDFGLKPAQFQVLAALRRLHPAPVTPKQLVDAAILTSGALTPVLDRLERTGHLSRRPDSGDRRSVLIELTEQGKALIESALDQRMARHRDLVAGLSAGEHEQLSALLRKLLRGQEGGSDR